MGLEVAVCVLLGRRAEFALIFSPIISEIDWTRELQLWTPACDGLRRMRLRHVRPSFKGQNTPGPNSPTPPNPGHPTHPGGHRYRRSLPRLAVELRPEESRSRLQNLIRPTQFEVLPLQLLDPLLLTEFNVGRDRLGFTIRCTEASEAAA